VLNPALIALAIAVSISMWPQAKAFLFTGTSFGRPFGDAFQKLGASTPVVATIVMSASLGRAVRAMCKSASTESDGTSVIRRQSMIPRWATALLVATRLVVLPCIGLAAMYLIERCFAGTMPTLSPAMRAVVLLELSSPAANNCVVLCQKLDLPNLAEDVAAAYVPMYLLCLITVPAYLSIGLYIFLP
jgi:predicted permease